MAGGGGRIPQRRSLVSPSSALSADCEAAAERNFAFCNPWGIGGRRASPRQCINPEVQHSPGLKTQQ